MLRLKLHLQTSASQTDDINVWRGVNGKSGTLVATSSAHEHVCSCQHMHSGAGAAAAAAAEAPQLRCSCVWCRLFWPTQARPRAWKKQRWAQLQSTVYCEETLVCKFVCVKVCPRWRVGWKSKYMLPIFKALMHSWACDTDLWCSEKIRFLQENTKCMDTCCILYWNPNINWPQGTGRKGRRKENKWTQVCEWGQIVDI